MKVRKQLNLYELVLMERVGMIRGEKFDSSKENELLNKIYNKLNTKFVNLELEDGKEIKDIKYIKVFNFENGKKYEVEMNIYNEILSDHFRNYDTLYEYRYDDKELIEWIRELNKITRIYEDKGAIIEDADLDSEDYYIEIEYED